ncbi:hypothetical protein OCF84_21110 (plasmid) [Shewanella xiamenensis]|uniref:Exodeoxyribonuclease X-like C-terminal domain-containing protein n=1 Tax=Shewanella xiamenensis TaxID=332186 RepID=A0ABT6UDS3_9GAMM|nr:hypothetical protein [Shewanella xiamenensis]MDI5832625.1 hypothetical protein [Shewanella xiamenensis]WHF57758.1 hypothetical protein OCF84_21110 [Shewanella xiamenensis]
MAYSTPAFTIQVQVHNFYIDESRTGNCKLLRCKTEFPLKRGAQKADVMFRYVGPLVPDYDASREEAYKYACQYANLYPSQIVTFEQTVFLAGNTTLEFGKYSGKTLDDVFTVNPSYIDWLAANMKPRNHVEQRIHLQCKFWFYSGKTKKVVC